ncbi:nitrite reductase small subunit NirD [Arenicella sp. 4NH20-0111]|uniref:nitrite reductase small subunit NirD n=1 Tax=Arenicella sp. 4NH20-0111 TaxID=3127648 RepID=UPI003105C96F
MNTSIICSKDDLIANSGVCAKIDNQQVALFYVPDTEQKVFAIDNWDPLGKANVMSRGVIGNIGDELVVASPLYKQHFSLITGECVEEDVQVATYKVGIDNEDVILLGD